MIGVKFTGKRIDVYPAKNYCHTDRRLKCTVTISGIKTCAIESYAKLVTVHPGGSVRLCDEIEVAPVVEVANKQCVSRTAVLHWSLKGAVSVSHENLHRYRMLRYCYVW